MVSNTPIATASSVGEFLGAQRIPFIREEVDCEDTAGLHQSVPPFAGHPLCLAGPSTPRFGVPRNWKIRYHARTPHRTCACTLLRARGRYVNEQTMNQDAGVVNATPKLGASPVVGAVGAVVGEGTWVSGL